MNRYGYLKCSIADKPEYAVVIFEPGFAGTYCWCKFKEHAELIATEELISGTVIKAEFVNGIPKIPDNAREQIERLNRDKDLGLLTDE